MMASSHLPLEHLERTATLVFGAYTKAMVLQPERYQLTQIFFIVDDEYMRTLDVVFHFY